jgi:AraC family transcriptional regulator, glycine betaine-responsive activator
MARPGIDLASVSRFGFLTLPNYSMIAVTNALEACRMANYVSGAQLYSWQTVTLDGLAVPASNGLSLNPTLALDQIGNIEVLFVCGGIDVRHATDRRLSAFLRRLARSGVTLGALCTGTFALAEAGLLDGYRCAIHWENLSAIREEFAAVSFVDDLFVIDRDRITCTGGVAPLDMMLALIEARLGRDLAAKVTDQFIFERARRGTDRQVSRVLASRGVKQPVLEKVARLMGETIEAPLAIDTIADRIGVSRRQLERLFKNHLGLTPAWYYASMRLDRARELLRFTNMSVTEVSIACGFQSLSHFSTTYRRQFGRSPRAEQAS